MQGPGSYFWDTLSVSECGAIQRLFRTFFSSGDVGLLAPQRLDMCEFQVRFMHSSGLTVIVMDLDCWIFVLSP